MIKDILIAFAFMLLAVASMGQAGRECATKAPRIKPLITEEQQQRVNQARVMYSAPYPLKIFVRVFADNDGTRIAADTADVLRQIQNMQSFYAPHNICFILTGYEVIRNTALNTMNIDEEEDDLDDFALENSLTIFVHDVLFDASGTSNGNAYGIPNNYLSIVSTAIASTTNQSTLAHEMGHCLGLLHTFEDAYGVENRARTGSCRDCEGDGDLLCDTNADRNLSETVISATTCQYTGSRVDDCDDQLLMEPQNIMTYGRRSCRDHFTSGQGNRALSYLLSTHEDLIAENALIVGNANLVLGLFNYAARNTIVFTATNFVVQSLASANFSSREIVFSPGVELKPASGYVVARAGVYCQ